MGDEGDVRSQLGARHVAGVDPADEDCAPRRVVEARQEVEERRLPRARRPADGDDLARLDHEVEAVQHVHFAAVREVDLLEADAERFSRQVPWLVGSGRGATPSSQPKLRPAEASARCARSRIQPIASSGQTSCSRSVWKRRMADRDLAVDDGAPAEEHDGGDRQRGQVVADRGRTSPRRRPGRARPADALGPLAEPFAHVVLAAEGLHHLDPDDGLVRGLGHVALARLHPARDRGDPPPEAVRHVPIGGSDTADRASAAHRRGRGRSRPRRSSSRSGSPARAPSR